MYNKTIQEKKKGIGWIEEVWKNNGWEESLNPVWRIEFQLRRDILKQFKANSPAEVLKALNSIWKYCTTEWLSLRQSNINDNTKSRWPIEQWWQRLSLQAFSPVSTEVVREKYQGTKFFKLLDGFIAYGTSLAAIVGIPNRDKVFALAGLLTDQRLHDKGKRFEDVVLEKRKKKGLE